MDVEAISPLVGSLVSSFTSSGSGDSQRTSRHRRRRGDGERSGGSYRSYNSTSNVTSRSTSGNHDNNVSARGRSSALSAQSDGHSSSSHQVSREDASTSKQLSCNDQGEATAHKNGQSALLTSPSGGATATSSRRDSTSSSGTGGSTTTTTSRSSYTTSGSGSSSATSSLLGAADSDDEAPSCCDSLCRWFHRNLLSQQVMLHELGVRFVTVILLFYFLGKGVMQYAVQYVVLPYFENRMGVAASKQQVYSMVATLGFSVKPMLGVLSDQLPILGYHKRSYIAIFLITSSLAILLSTFIPADPTYGPLAAILFFLGLLGISGTDLLVEGKYSEFIHHNAEAGPAVVSLAWACVMLGALGAAGLEGPIADSQGPVLVLYIVFSFALAPLVPVLLNWIADNRVDVTWSMKCCGGRAGSSDSNSDGDSGNKTSGDHQHALRVATDDSAPENGSLDSRSSSSSPSPHLTRTTATSPATVPIDPPEEDEATPLSTASQRDGPTFGNTTAAKLPTPTLPPLSGSPVDQDCVLAGGSKSGRHSDAGITVKDKRRNQREGSSRSRSQGSKSCWRRWRRPFSGLTRRINRTLAHFYRKLGLGRLEDGSVVRAGASAVGIAISTLAVLLGVLGLFSSSDVLLIVVLPLVALVLFSSLYILPVSAAKAIICIFLNEMLYVRITSYTDYYYTSDASCVPEGPHFNMTYYQTTAGIVTNVGGAIGVVLFQLFLSRSSIRWCFYSTTLLQEVASIVDIIIIKRWNVNVLHIPDKIAYVFGDAFIGQLCIMLGTMPASIMFAKLCPKGLESTMFALVASTYNFGDAVSKNIGHFVADRLNIQLGKNMQCEYDNLIPLVIIAHLCLPLLKLPLIRVLFPGSKINEDFNFSNEGDSTFSSSSGDDDEEDNNQDKQTAEPYAT